MEYLLPYCVTPKQIQQLNTVIDNDGNAAAAARELGLSPSTITQLLINLRAKAARQGESPEHDMRHTVPAGFQVKGVSTFYNEEGKPVNQWVKSKIDPEQQAAIQLSLAEGFAKDLPRAKKSKGRRKAIKASPDLANLYVLSDCHLGMMASATEGGEDWDLERAVSIIQQCWQQALNQSPDADTGIISVLGDYFHTDGLTPVTPKSKHVLDQSSRFPDVLEAGIQLLKGVIADALEKHEHVRLVISEGNHDEASSLHMRVMFKHFYEREPRVQVDTTAAPYTAIQHGKVMLGFHHGHIRGIDGAQGTGLALKFANSPEWQGMDYRYIHTGHKHHRALKEQPGVEMVQHQTLAAPDAHAKRGAYDSKRAMKTFTYHKDYGEVGDITVRPEMFD